MYNAYAMKEQRLRQIFIWIVAISGFILVFLSPPLAVPDENTHFINAYCTSRLNLFPDVNPENGVIGKYLPQYIATFAYRANYAGKLDEGYSFSENYFDSWLPVKDEERVPVFCENNLVTINPWSYVVSGCGMRIASVVCSITGGGFDNAYNLMIAGRMANLLFYILVGYWAVSVTPCLKKTMMLLMSMPISLFLAASLSYDAILIPVSMLLFAELMKLFMGAEQDKVTKKDILTVAFCTLFLTAVKMAYAPFLGLLLLVPIKKFKTTKQYISAIGIVGAMGFIGLVIPKMVSAFATKNAIRVENANIAIQRKYLMQHIYMFPKIILNTFEKYRNFYTSSFVAKLGQLDTNFPIIYIGLFIMILWVVILYECSNVTKIKWTVRLGAILAVCIVIVGLNAAMYITWTPLVEEPCGDFVSGTQGRYFIPIFCFGLIPIFNNLWNKIPKGVNKKVSFYIENITLFFIGINSILTILFLLLRYWCW